MCTCVHVIIYVLFIQYCFYNLQISRYDDYKMYYIVIIMSTIGLEELQFKYGFHNPSKTNLDISNQPAITGRMMCQ